MNQLPFEINAQRLLCPMPLIRLQDAAKKLTPGTQVLIHCTDPGARYDIPAWCRVHHHQLISMVDDEAGLHILVQLTSI